MARREDARCRTVRRGLSPRPVIILLSALASRETARSRVWFANRNLRLRNVHVHVLLWKPYNDTLASRIFAIHGYISCTLFAARMLRGTVVRHRASRCLHCRAQNNGKLDDASVPHSRSGGLPRLATFTTASIGADIILPVAERTAWYLIYKAAAVRRADTLHA